MFNWIQHLFTVRALERELSDLRSENSAMKSDNAVMKLEIKQLKKVITVKEKEIRRINDEFEAFKQFHSKKPIKSPTRGGGKDSWMG